MAEKMTGRFILSLLAATLISSGGAGHATADEKSTNKPSADNDQPAKDNKFKIKIGGFAKTDVIISDYNGGPVSDDSLGRDLYVPATLPAGTIGDRYLDMHGKESRINFSATRAAGNKPLFKAFLEVDFLRCNLESKHVANALDPRLRHAFIQYGNWLFGQTWTTLFNVSALPENLDFIGPSESTIFRRQAMIRYARGPWQIAVENPRTTITPFGGGPRINADNIRTPDVVLRYNFEDERSTFTAAGVARQLGYQNIASRINDRTTGYGISLSGKVTIGDRDDFRWMASTGTGLGHYFGLNTANGAVLGADNKLETIASTGLFSSFRHFWSERWRSNFTLGYLAVDNDVALTGDKLTSKASSMHVNLIYSPRTALDFGVEFLLASRELENGAEGKLNRLQFSVKYGY